ncbi:MAG TPA: type II CAAX endopeptidase family protein [Thermoanaerobaculia bacterium]|nr:type II CAAX endopeptidase family protein [Thermoanaerobaculia bacterium]
MLANASLSALLNLVVLGGLPFLLYFAYQKWRYKRGFGEVAQRAGLQLGEGRYVIYSLAFALAGVAFLVTWPPPLEPFLRPGSPQQSFRGLGLAGAAVPMALLYGVAQTGFTEELLFRGLIAGSLSRRFSLLWANLVQAFIFLIPHVLVLRIMPEMWGILPVIFAIALLVGWVRIKSRSIIGGWVIHASVNVATCLSVAIRTAT